MIYFFRNMPKAKILVQELISTERIGPLRIPLISYKLFTSLTAASSLYQHDLLRSTYSMLVIVTINSKAWTALVQIHCMNICVKVLFDKTVMILFSLDAAAMCESGSLRGTWFASWHTIIAQKQNITTTTKQSKELWVESVCESQYKVWMHRKMITKIILPCNCTPTLCSKYLSGIEVIETTHSNSH